MAKDGTLLGRNSVGASSHIREAICEKIIFVNYLHLGREECLEPAGRFIIFPGAPVSDMSWDEIGYRSK